MKVPFSIALFLFVVTVSIGQVAHYSDVDRILTVERWYRQEGRVWIVQNSRLLVYDANGKPRRLLFTRVLGPDEAAFIRSLRSSLPKTAFGIHHAGGYSTHPPLLRLHFTPDGRWDDGRIEVSGFSPQWSTPLLDAVSKLCAPEWRVDFDQAVASYRSRLSDPYFLEVRAVSIPDFHGPSKPWWRFWQ